MTVERLASRFLFVEIDERTPGQRIHDRRTALGLSVRELARLAKVDRGRLTLIEADRAHGVRDSTLGAIESALSRLEEEFGMDTPDLVTNAITLKDGTRVTFAGPADGVAEAAAKFLREHGEG